MKIVWILNNSRYVGGGDYSIFKFAEYMAKAGHDIEIFVTVGNPYVIDVKKSKLMKIHCQGSIPLKIKGMGLLNRIWEKIYFYLRVVPFVKKDVDFIIGVHTTSTIKANILAKIKKIPCVSFVFETPDWMESQLKERWRKEYNGRFKKLWIKTKKHLKEVDVIFSNSKLTGDENEKWLGKKLNGVIYPGLDVEIVDSLKNVKKENQIIYIGRLNNYKNIDVLIKAISKIENSPKLVVCGGGEEKENLIKLAKELKVNVDFKGRVSERDKWIEIKKSLFMVFPSSFEGFGMPPMEALYSEIPCICSDIPILKEVYDDKVEYFKENDIDDLVKKIKFLIKNKNYREKRGKLGRDYIKKKYNWKKSAKKIEQILSDFSNEKK